MTPPRGRMAAALRRLLLGRLPRSKDFARMVRQGLGAIGLHEAVCEFAVERRWPFVDRCLQDEALHDVALRRPLA